MSIGPLLNYRVCYICSDVANNRYRVRARDAGTGGARGAAAPLALCQGGQGGAESAL